MSAGLSPYPIHPVVPFFFVSFFSSSGTIPWKVQRRHSNEVVVESRAFSTERPRVSWFSPPFPPPPPPPPPLSLWYRLLMRLLARLFLPFHVGHAAFLCQRAEKKRERNSRFFSRASLRLAEGSGLSEIFCLDPVTSFLIREILERERGKERERGGIFKERSRL